MLTAMGYLVWCGGNLGPPLSSLAYEAATNGDNLPHIAAVEVSSNQLEPHGDFLVAAACILHAPSDDLARNNTLETRARTEAKLIEHLKPCSVRGAIVSQEVVKLCGNTKVLHGCARVGQLPGVMLKRNEAQVLHCNWTRARSLDPSALQCPGQHNMVNAAVRAHCPEWSCH
jgi:UDP-N-acetylmuramoylalanine-D-glutamate ligase